MEGRSIGLNVHRNLKNHPPTTDASVSPAPRCSGC